MASAVPVQADDREPAADGASVDQGTVPGGDEPSGARGLELSPQVAQAIEKLDSKYPDRAGKVKYERSGHQYTTYIVSMAAGLGRELSHELSAFSQYPDDEKQFSATSAAFRVFDQEYRREIMAVLHSLHGGGQEEVLKRRRDLKALTAAGIKDGALEPYQVGLVIHAFADSYAHTTGDQADGTLEAFDYVVGHLFHGHTPDLIAYDPPKYRAYSCALFEALASKGRCEERLADLFAIIDGLKTDRKSELPRFEALAKDRYGYDADIYRSVVERSKVVDRERVKATIVVMEQSFAQ